MNKAIKIGISMFMMWIILLLPMSFADALSITFNDVQVTHNTATVNWQTDVDADSSVVYGEDTPPTNEEASARGTTHSVVLTDLIPGTLYFFKLTAVNGADTATDDNSGSYYQFTTNQPPDTTAPGAPTVSVDFVTKDQVGLSFQKAAGDNDVKEFNVYRDGQKIATKQIQGTGAAYTDNDVEPSTAYNYEVSAVDLSDNEGPKTSAGVSTQSENYRQITLQNVRADVFGTDDICAHVL